MDQVKPLPSQNGLPTQEHLPPDLELVNNHTSNDVIVRGKQLMDGGKESEIADDRPTEDGPAKSPARGLELIYKVAEELATRIADEKRYEGIIRPCFVQIQRISDASQYKIIRDETMIMDESISDATTSKKEVITNGEKNQNYDDMQMDCYDSSDDEEEIILPSEDDENEKNNESPEDKASFSCIFCRKKNIQGKSVASDHYQSHLDYYPYKCSHCLEVTTSLKNLFIHYRKDHSEEKTATFKKKLMPWVIEWIDDFLKSQICPGRGRNTIPRPYCPVCETSEKKEDIIMIPPNLIQPRKQMMHIYKHLVYEPYVCLLCQKAGKKFTANDFDDRVYEHILRHHPEAEDKLLNQVFEKSRHVKALEKFIIHYLTAAGVSTKRRVPEKIPFFARNKFKSKQEVKEINNVDKDINRTVTLGDLANQSSTSLLNDQSDVLTIGQKIDNATNLSNQTKTNLNTTLTSHQINKTPSLVNKPVNMFASPGLLISPPTGPLPQIATLTVNGMTIPNVLALTSVSIVQKNSTVNGNNTPHHQSILHPNYQQPNVIQLPCGQLMVRNSPPTPSQSPPESITKHQSKFGRSILSSPPSILRRATITNPSTREPNLNGPVEIKAYPDVGSFVGIDVTNQRKQEDDFVRRNYFCVFCKELVYFGSFLEGLFHFSKHLDYKPVNCLLCCEQFPDMDSIMKHFVEIHAHKKVCQDSSECEPLLYYINREGHTEKWLEQYLYFQVSGELERLANVDCSTFCNICKSIVNNARFPSRATLKKPAHMTPPIEVVRQHLNLHINYRPYECYLCSKAGNQIKFASIGELATKHLKTHGFSPVDKNFIKEFFNFKPIHGLENFIKNYLITEYYPYANTFVSRENINGIKTIDQPAPFTLNGVNNQTYLKSSGDNIQRQHLFTDTDHTNGPISSSPFSLSSSQNRDLKKLTRSVFACYHCKLSINGVQELVTHCKAIHPNLSIASYCLPTLNGMD